MSSQGWSLRIKFAKFNYTFFDIFEFALFLLLSRRKRFLKLQFQTFLFVSILEFISRGLKRLMKFFLILQAIFSCTEVLGNF